MPINTSAEAFAPASMGNVGVGFDILGLAFQGLGDAVRVEFHNDPGVTVLDITGINSDQIPLNPTKNSAAVAVQAFLQTIGTQQGIGITIKKGLPIASGLGGSAASAVAAAVAANALFGEPLQRQELLPACLKGEAAVSGYHLDNVAPCLLGGITLIVDTETAQIQSLPVPEGLFFALITPSVQVPTAEARQALPQSVSLKKLVAQTGAVARLMDALHRGDVRAVAAAMEQDGIIEPARAHLMPEFYRIRAAAKRAGALSLVISGAGPTLCAVCDSPAAAQQAASAMAAVYHEAKIAYQIHLSQVNQQGAQVIAMDSRSRR